MRALIASLVSLTVLACLAATTARAQRPQARQGFWIGFGLGYGEAYVTCAACGTASEGGPAGFLRLGGTLSPKVLLGGAVNAWSKSSQGATEILGNVTGSISYYPAAASGFFVTGGIGLSHYNLSGYGATSSTGWGVRAGAGYDIRVGRMISLTPVSELTYGGGLSPHGQTGWKQTVIDLGLGVTFH